MNMTQEKLRMEVKQLKWQDDIDFKTIAEDLLEMDYHSFINWKNGLYNLGYEKTKTLTDYIDTLKE